MSAAASVVQRFWQLMAGNDFAAVAAVLTDDFALDWPQSGERIRGAADFAALNAAYPAHGPWRFHLLQVFGNDDRAVSEVDVSDGVQQARAISLFELRDGRIAGIREYWPQAYPAPAWRAAWVQRIAGLPATSTTD